MFSIGTVILYLTMVIVTINGQTPYSLPITTSMTATCNAATCEGFNPNTKAFDTDAATCAATNIGPGAMITIDLKATYTIYSITITVKQKIIMGPQSIETTDAGVNAGSGNRMTVAVSATTDGPGTACTSATPATPFTLSGAGVNPPTATAVYSCANTNGQYIVLTGAGTDPNKYAALVCLFTVMQIDTTTTATTTTKAAVTTSTSMVAKSSRFVTFDSSIIFAILLAAVKVTMDNVCHY